MIKVLFSVVILAACKRQGYTPRTENSIAAVLFAPRSAYAYNMSTTFKNQAKSNPPPGIDKNKKYIDKSHLCVYNNNMKLVRTIFIFVLCITAVHSPASANCSDPEFKKNNPSRCQNYTSATTGLLGLGGGIAALGGALALISVSGAHGGGGSAHSTTIPTISTYNNVGGDVDSAHLAAIMGDLPYTKNFDQYNDIRLAYATARGYTGAGTTIAVMDTGMDHPHARAVVEIASGPIAPNATIESYQIAYDSVTFMPYDQIGAVMQSAQNADVINNSWNIHFGADKIRSRAQIAALTDAKFIQSISDASAHGAIFVWAAGNDKSTQSGALSAMPRVMPELKGHFVNVVAWDSATGQLAAYSNACGVTKDYCITAPGSDYAVNVGHVSGTSFAAPTVSAAIAVLREAFPYMTAPEITDLLFTTARDLGTPGVDDVYGWGMLDLERATRPVGAPLVPLSDGMTVPLRNAHVPASIAKKIESADPKFAFVDSFGRAFTTRVSDNISVRNRGLAFDRLRPPARASVNIGNLEFGFRNSEFLGTDGFLKTDDKTTINFIASRGSLHIGHTEIFQHTEIGTSSPRPTPESMINAFSDIYTASATIGMRRGDWEFAISAPDTIIHGTMELRMPTGRRADGVITFSNYNLDISSKPTLEYSIKYKSITAGFIDNPYGTDEIYVIAKTRLNF